MKYKRMGRSFLCLLVVCVLLFNIITMPVHATGAGLLGGAVAGVAAVPGLNVVAGVLIGLGVLVGVSCVDWDGIAQDCYQYLRKEGIVDLNGNIDVLAIDAVDWAWGVSQELISKVRDWLFAEEIVLGSAAENGLCLYNGHALPALPSDVGPYIVMYAFSFYSLGRQPVIFSGDSGFSHAAGSTRTKYRLIDGVWTYDSSSTSALNSNGQIIWTNFRSTDTYLEGGIHSALDVSLGQVFDPSVEIAVGYDAWAGNAIAVPGTQLGSDSNDDVLVYPIGLGQTWEETRGLSQTDAWSGTSTYVDTSATTVPITGSLGDTQASTFIDSLVDAIASIFIPSQSLESYGLSLTEFFPFCIPFDIYEFLSALAAEPEAPVFEWVIPVPQMDKNFSVRVDLSAWNDVAALFRKLELLAFIIGLAYVSREKFLRG